MYAGRTPLAWNAAVFGPSAPWPPPTRGPVEFAESEWVRFTKDESFRHAILWRAAVVEAVIGEVGTILGRLGVNIANFALGRDETRAMGIVNVDEEASKIGIRLIGRGGDDYWSVLDKDLEEREKQFTQWKEEVETSWKEWKQTTSEQDKVKSEMSVVMTELSRLRSQLASAGIDEQPELQQQIAEHEERRRELGAIRTAIGGLTKMVDNVLALGRFDAAAKNNETRVNLEPFCRELWDETQRALKAPHRLELKGTAAQRNILVDETFLRVVLSNLLQNAIKYAPDGDRVTVVAETDKTDCIITVTDYGRGIPVDEQETIFEAFQRGASATSTSGTGLGLAVAKAAAERLGGSLGVESVPGSGSTFKLVLPGTLKARPSLRRKEKT